MTRMAKLGAAGFALWGVLHVAGGAVLIGRGYGAYGRPEIVDVAAVGVLRYFGFMLILAGVAAATIAATMNRRNDALGLALNTGMILAVEAGLVAFLILPGVLGWAEASPGFILAVAGIVAGGIACRRAEGTAHVGG